MHLGLKIVPHPIAAWRSGGLAVWQSDCQLIWFVLIAQCLRYSADETEPLEDRLNIQFRSGSSVTVGDGQVVDLARCHLRILIAIIPATITVQCGIRWDVWRLVKTSEEKGGRGGGEREGR